MRDVAAAEFLGNGELIEIARVVVVDRAPDQVAEIAASVVTGRPAERGDLRFGGTRKVGFEATIAHRLARDLLQESTG